MKDKNEAEDPQTKKRTEDKTTAGYRVWHPAVAVFSESCRISSFLRALRNMLSDARIPDRLPEPAFRLRCGRSFCTPIL